MIVIEDVKTDGSGIYFVAVAYSPTRKVEIRSKGDTEAEAIKRLADTIRKLNA